MTASNLFAFALASLVMVALPGPDQALITRNTLVGGMAAARRTMLGGACGLSLHATAAAGGITALLATSATAFTTLKLVGVVYLVFLALRMLTSSAAAHPHTVRLDAFEGSLYARVPKRACGSSDDADQRAEPVTASALLAFAARLVTSANPDDSHLT